MMQKRIAWVDMAKGYGMLLVILAHLGIGVVGTWIYTFHMPLFFLLSGYVFQYENNFGTFVKKKAKSMIIPYFCLGIPMLLFSYLGYIYKGGKSINDYLYLAQRFIIQRRLWTLWFLACLFFLNIGFFFVKKILKTELRITVFSVILIILGLLYYKVGGTALPWNVDVCPMAFPFFFVGNLYRTHESIIDRYFDNPKYSITIFIASGIINVGCGYFTHKISGCGLEMFYSSYGFAPLTYISAFAGIVCVIILSKWTTIAPIQYIGKYSLLYFAWHQTIMIPISSIILRVFHFSIDEMSTLLSVSIYKITQVLIIVVLITLCNEIIRRTKLRFMLGKV